MQNNLSDLEHFRNSKIRGLPLAVGAVPYSVAVPINGRMRLFALASLDAGDAGAADAATFPWWRIEVWYRPGRQFGGTTDLYAR